MKICNYSSISLTSIAYKVYVRIVRNAIVGHLHRQHILNDSQHGFLSGRTCITNLLGALKTGTPLLDDKENVHM